KDKAKVETGVKCVEQWILARLRKIEFFSLSELNLEIKKLLIEYNDKPFQKLPGCRRSAFVSIDKPALKPLPSDKYYYTEIKYSTVGIDYHVELDGHYYSVPHQLTKSKVELHLENNCLSIYHKGERIAVHAKSFAKGAHTTITDHMPEEHKYFSDWSPAKFIDKATFEEQLEQPNTYSELSCEDRIGMLVEREYNHRNNKRIERLIRTARFKIQAKVEDINYSHPRGLSKDKMANLANGEWLKRNQNLLITGPTGCGKTYLACAIGNHACRQGLSVSYYRAPRLFEALTIAHANGTYQRLIKSIAKSKLLIIDDWGLDQLSSSHRTDLLEIMEDRHGSSCTLVTSQLPTIQWHESIGDPTLADAILDRLLHNAHKLPLNGDSMRKINNNLTDVDQNS
ncbi:Insertion sequence IS408 putative ATP-binding protein, partial [Exaiptasia diaphana]